jgi:endonuclease/exonuclease/phosphatase family metal-dependent hydrolase
VDLRAEGTPRPGNPRRMTPVAAIIAAAVLLASCSGPTPSPTATPAPTPGPAAPAATPAPTPEPGEENATATGKPMQLRVMEFNIEYGGALVSLAKTEEAIRLAGADVVGIEESYDSLPTIAKATGYPYYNVSLQILSKYPVLEPSGGNGLYALIEVQAGYVIAFCNIHLDYVDYGPTALLGGQPVDAVIATEDKVRTSALGELLPVLTRLAEQGYPVFLAGDFNEPSSLDYVAATVGRRPQIMAPVAWPVSEALFKVGFRDSYRDVYPDAAKNQGITWPAERPQVADWAGNPVASDPRDRIDYIYAAGPSRTLTSEVMGEKGGPDVSLSVTPWPSDHRAVVSTFDTTPLAMPAMVAVNSRLLTVGDTVTLTYSAPGQSGHKAAVVAAGGDPGSPLLSEDAPGQKGTLLFDTSRLPAGGYEAVLTAGNGAEVARVPIWLRAKAAKVELSTDKPSYAVGEPITVSWTGGPANRWDWIGVYKAKAADPNVDDYLIWDYTNLHASGTVPPEVDGSLTLEGSSQGAPWPLPPGKYTVYYLLTDAYTAAGSAHFTVTR